MNEKRFPSSGADNEGAYIPGSAGKGGDPGMPIRPGAGKDSGASAHLRGQSGGSDPGNSGAGIAGGDVEAGGVERSPAGDIPGEESATGKE